NEFQFKLHGTDVTNRGMAPLAIVEDVDVLPDCYSGCRPRLIDLMVDELSFESAEEALGNGVVPAVAFAAHARHHLVHRQCSTVVVAGVGASAVGVMQQPGGRTPGAGSAGESLHGEGSVVVCARRPAHDAPGAEVENNSEVKPSLKGPDVRHV